MPFPLVQDIPKLGQKKKKKKTSISNLHGISIHDLLHSSLIKEIMYLIP